MTSPNPFGSMAIIEAYASAVAGQEPTGLVPPDVLAARKAAAQKVADAADARETLESMLIALCLAMEARGHSPKDFHFGIGKWWQEQYGRILAEREEEEERREKAELARLLMKYGPELKEQS
jgi:Mg-chelatase subunit ChlI